MYLTCCVTTSTSGKYGKCMLVSSVFVRFSHYRKPKMAEDDLFCLLFRRPSIYSCLIIIMSLELNIIFKPSTPSRIWQVLRLE